MPDGFPIQTMNFKHQKISPLAKVGFGQSRFPPWRPPWGCLPQIEFMCAQVVGHGHWWARGWVVTDAVHHSNIFYTNLILEKSACTFQFTGVSSQISHVLLHAVKIWTLFQRVPRVRQVALFLSGSTVDACCSCHSWVLLREGVFGIILVLFSHILQMEMKK